MKTTITAVGADEKAIFFKIVRERKEQEPHEQLVSVNKPCKCKGICDCVMLKPEDLMNDPQSEFFVSKMNIIDDKQFEAAMKKLKDEKRQRDRERNHGAEKSADTQKPVEPTSA
jgi:hypothetical protein